MRASCVLLALLAVACATESDDNTRTDPQPVGPVDGYVDVGGVNLHYRDYGGTGDLLVFVPGFNMPAHVYDRLAQRFADRYRVLALTHRWHGTSDTTGLNFDLDTLASDVAGFIDHFTEDPAIVVGWATAGLVLPRLARQRPDLVRALVFANAVWASVPLPPGVPRWPPGGTPPDSVYPSLEAAAEHMQPSMNITSTAALIGVLAGYLHQRADGMYAWLPPFGTRAEARFYAWYDSAAVYDGLDVPVLAIQVKQSKALTADYEARGIPRDTIDLALRWYREYYDVSLDLGVEALRAAVPDAEVIVLDDLNHNYMIENPDVVAPIIGDFLGRLASRAAAQVPATDPFRARFASVPRMDAEVVPVSTESGVSLERISAVAGGQDGTLYVLHRPESGDPVVALDRNGRLLRSWGAGLFRTPHGIRVDPATGNVWTVDASSSKVLEFTPRGDLLLETQLDRPDREDTFCGATDVAFGPDGRVFVADGYCNSRIVEIDGRGGIVREWGAPGSGPGELDIPHAIVYGPDGLLYVADRENGRVQRFTTTGEFVDGWEYAGQLLGIAFAPGGRLFLSLSLGGGPVDAHVVEVNPGTGEMLARAEVVAHELSVGPDGTVLPAAYGHQALLLRLANDR